MPLSSECPAKSSPCRLSTFVRSVLDIILSLYFIKSLLHIEVSVVRYKLGDLFVES